jgi:deoxyribonuclease V
MKTPLPFSRWPTTVAEGRVLQERLCGLLDLASEFHLREGMLIAGVDVSYEKRATDCHAVIAVLRWPGWETVTSAAATTSARFPYVPGYLAFREGPPVMRALRRLRVSPDLFLVDSHGTAHPRRFGSASLLGLCFGKPTIGCAKTRLCGVSEEPGPVRGDAAPLLAATPLPPLRPSHPPATPLRGKGPGDGGMKQIGWVLRSRAGTKPIYISPGHMISMDASLATARRLLGRYRILEPIRAAHAMSNRLRQGFPLEVGRRRCDNSAR